MSNYRFEKVIMDVIISQKFDFDAAKRWATGMEWTVLNISFTYVVVIFAIKYAMRDRKPYDLQLPLVLWNAFLAIFSILGVLRLTPVFFAQISSKGYISKLHQIQEVINFYMHCVNLFIFQAPLLKLALVSRIILLAIGHSSGLCQKFLNLLIQSLLCFANGH